MINKRESEILNVDQMMRYFRYVIVIFFLKGCILFQVNSSRSLDEVNSSRSLDIPWFSRSLGVPGSPILQKSESKHFGIYNFGVKNYNVNTKLGEQHDIFYPDDENGTRSIPSKNYVYLIEYHGFTLDLMLEKIKSQDHNHRLTNMMSGHFTLGEWKYAEKTSPENEILSTKEVLLNNRAFIHVVSEGSYKILKGDSGIKGKVLSRKFFHLIYVGENCIIELMVPNGDNLQKDFNQEYYLTKFVKEGLVIF